MTRRRSTTTFVLAGLLVALLLAGFVSGYASSSPDGLERVATDQGIAATERDHAFSGFPLADYAVAGVEDERLAGGLAGVIGVVLTFAVGAVVLGGVRLLGRGSRRDADRSAGPAASGAAAPGAAAAR